MNYFVNVIRSFDRINNFQIFLHIIGLISFRLNLLLSVFIWTNTQYILRKSYIIAFSFFIFFIDLIEFNILLHWCSKWFIKLSIWILELFLNIFVIVIIILITIAHDINVIFIKIFELFQKIFKILLMILSFLFLTWNLIFFALWEFNSILLFYIRLSILINFICFILITVIGTSCRCSKRWISFLFLFELFIHVYLLTDWLWLIDFIKCLIINFSFFVLVLYLARESVFRGSHLVYTRIDMIKTIRG